MPAGDNSLDPLDAVLVINALNAGTNGEAADQTPDTDYAIDALFSNPLLSILGIGLVDLGRCYPCHASPWWLKPLQ